MENKTAQADNNYYSNINRLIRYFTRTTSGYAFASIANQQHIKGINNQLREYLNDRQQNLEILNFNTQGDLPLVEQLKKTARSGADAIVVNNMGLMVEISDGVLTEKGSNFLLGLNFAREELLHLGIPILFWASKSVLGIISNQAADLYTQRSINTVYFDQYPDEAKPETELETRFLPAYRNTPDYETLELKIKLLKKQLADAEQNAYPLINIANQLALPLAKTYSEIDLHPQAAALLEKYGEFFRMEKPEAIIELADIAKNANQYVKAIDYFLQAIKIAEKENDKYTISYSFEKLGDIYQSLGDFDKALKYFDLEADLFKELYDANPKSENLKNGLAVSYSKLGGIYQSLGDLDKALQYFDLDIKLSKELFDVNPKSENLKNSLAVSYQFLGNIYFSLGKIEDALSSYLEMSKYFKELSESNPKSEDLKNGLAISYSKLGEIYQSLGDLDKALKCFDLDIQLSKELFDANPKSENLKNGLAISYEKLGGILLSMNKGIEAKENFALSKKMFTDLVKENSKSIDNQSNYAELSAISAIFEIQGQNDNMAAINQLNDSVQIWQELYKLSGRDYYLKKIELANQFLSHKIDYKTAINKLAIE